MKPLRICFAGTPGFAAGHLQALLDAGLQVCAVYTQPDRPAGRGKKLQPSPVKALALEHQLPVFQPRSLKDEQVQQEFRDLGADVLVVVAYGLILPAEILAVPAFGCLNVHASLLPRWRGAAPIERALMAGDEKSGVTIMQMDAGLDTGPMLHREEVEISAKDNRIDLENKLLEAGKRSLVFALKHLEQLQAEAQAQRDEDATYAHKLDKEEALIDWAQPAVVIDRQLRALVGRSPAYTWLGTERLRILEASISRQGSTETGPGTIVSAGRDHITVACGEACLEIHTLQLPGKKPVSVRDVMNSRPQLLAAGTVFTSTAAAL